MAADSPHRLGTIAVTAGRPEKTPDAPLNVPITMASTYVAGGDVEYGRYGNPTWTALEDALGALEGGRCLTFASGLAAVATVLDLVGTEGKVVVPKHAYTGTIMQIADLESRGRLKAELVDITDTDAVVAACADAALVWLESPTNPALEIADIPRRVPTSSSTTPSPLPCSSARSRTVSTWSSTRRPSTSPATPTCRWARSSPATTTCTPCSRADAT